MYFKRILVILLVCFSASALYAQKPIAKQSVSLGWDALFPTGSRQFLNDPYFTNASLTYEYRVIKQLSVGASFGYYFGKEEGDMRIQYDGDIVNGFTKKEFTGIPMQVQLRYFPLGGKSYSLQPYIMVSGGVQYGEYTITGDNLHGTSEKVWSAAMYAGVAARYAPDCMKGFFIDAGCGFYYSGSKWESVDAKSIMNINAKIAFGYAF